MALRDTWHRALVYFGLAEEREFEDDELDRDRERDRDRDRDRERAPEPEAELEDRYRDRPNVRRLSGRRRRDEIDDIFAEDTGDRRPTGVLRSVNPGAAPRPGNGRSDVRVHLVTPRSFNDAQDVADKFKDSIPV